MTSFQLLLLFLCLPLTLGAAPQPNVIIVMTDDQGYPELSVHGNPALKTPHLDKLHGQSIRLTDYHVAPMCTPTRGQLLTGIDAARNGASNVSSGRALLRPEIPTIANYFGDTGYSTGVFGKWHLGANYPYRPQDRGFQESVWYPSSSIPSVPAFWGNDFFDDVYTKNGMEERFKGYCTDVFFSEAKKFIQKSAKQNKPFLCYLATNTLHILAADGLFAPRWDSIPKTNSEQPATSLTLQETNAHGGRNFDLMADWIQRPGILIDLENGDSVGVLVSGNEEPTAGIDAEISRGLPLRGFALNKIKLPGFLINCERRDRVMTTIRNINPLSCWMHHALSCAVAFTPRPLRHSRFNFQDVERARFWVVTQRCNLQRHL